jgi:uncharacterized membrane protein
MRNRIFGLVCLVVMVAFSAYVYPMLPEQVPSHWGINGQVDGYSPRLVAATFAPLLALLLVVLREVLPRFDPHRARYNEFRGTYELIWNAIVLFIVAIHGITLGYAIGWPINVATVVQISVGLLFVVLGNELGRLRPNWFMGVRTPWTLANEEVWRRTHRATGRLMVGLGLIMALVVPFLPGILGFAVIISAALGFAVFALGYSYLLWRQITHV